jgi:hypothetical protein
MQGSLLKVATRWFNHDHFGARNDILDRNFPYQLLATRGFAPHHPIRMVEEPISLHRVAAEVSATLPQVTFDRPELNRILTVYGRMVAAGEWRDYALDFLDEMAVFSVFRHASEMPLFRIEKRPKLRAKQGQYSVVAAGGLILKRGQELAQVLKVFDKKLLKALSKD